MILCWSYVVNESNCSPMILLNAGKRQRVSKLDGELPLSIFRNALSGSAEQA